MVKKTDDPDHPIHAILSLLKETPDKPDKKQRAVYQAADKIDQDNLKKFIALDSPQYRALLNTLPRLKQHQVINIFNHYLDTSRVDNSKALFMRLIEDAKQNRLKTPVKKEEQHTKRIRTAAQHRVYKPRKRYVENPYSAAHQMAEHILEQQRSPEEQECVDRANQRRKEIALIAMIKSLAEANKETLEATAIQLKLEYLLPRCY